VLGATLVMAGLYQFTPLKRVCLSHCRSPLTFVAQHWRDGWGGALAMRLRHGTYAWAAAGRCSRWGETEPALFLAFRRFGHRGAIDPDIGAPRK
jgi:hypothetical protein